MAHGPCKKPDFDRNPDQSN